MNPAHRQRVSRKPSKRAGLGPSPAPSHSLKTRGLPKADFLRRFQDTKDDNDVFLEPDMFGDELDDEFKTLKISDVDKWRQGLKHESPTALRRNPKLFAENEDDFLDLEQDFQALNEPERARAPAKRHSHKKLGASPATRSSASPVRRVSLSEYSENTNETDLTSELNVDEFENIDDIFGDEESGIYTSGGQSVRIKERLLNQQQQRQAVAQRDEEELTKQMRAREDVNTLRIKDVNAVDLEKDALENERTINYEYTKDDFEDFEDGFELEPAVKFGSHSIKKFANLRPKGSMPNVRHSTSAVRQSKKFKSTMDLNHELRQSSTYNSSDRVMNKLNRIPSFYNRPQEADTAREEHNDEFNDIEEKKQQLLEKYMEFTEKQNKISRKKQQRTERPRNSKIGLLRNLNEVPVTSGNHHMKYDPVKKMWEGNNIDLIKFDLLRQKLSRPLLITSKEFKSNTKDKKIHGNMIYDADKMKWISLEEEDDVFGEVSDLVVHDTRDRGASTYTQRTISTASASSGPSNSQELSRQEEFFLSPKLMEKFLKEESKIRKKTAHWFGKNEVYKPSKHTAHDDFRWEIRKMVMDAD